MHWLAYGGIGAIAAVVLVVIAHGMHETRATRRFVAEALRNRPCLTDEEFGKRFYEPALAPLAARLRANLKEITGDDVAFMVYTSGTTGNPSR